MSEMIERLAQAIIDAGYNPATARPIARIVVAAMREPTKEMIEAHDDYPFMPEAMNAMIDAALKVTEPAV